MLPTISPRVITICLLCRCKQPKAYGLQVMIDGREAERIGLVRKAVENIGAMNEVLVPELAWQMGRPVKFGAGELGGFEERARGMIGLAESALAPVVPAEKDGFKRYIRRDPLGVVLTRCDNTSSLGEPFSALVSSRLGLAY